MNDALLTINTGSSSIKFAVFSCTVDNKLCRIYNGAVDGIGEQIIFSVISEKNNQNKITKNSLNIKNHSQALQYILNWLNQEAPSLGFVATGHRVVHGGTAFSEAVHINHNVLLELKKTHTTGTFTPASFTRSHRNVDLTTTTGATSSVLRYSLPYKYA